MDEQLTFHWGRESPGDDLLPHGRALRERLGRLAGRGVFLGGSSWKYPGWLGQIYTPDRYQTRGRLSTRKFNDECLSEYARIFPTVCGDFAFYQFPTPQMWARTFEQVPVGFRFALKVPEDITVQRFPKLARYGTRAGAQNPHFMDASMLRDQLLDLLEPYHDRLGPVIFEFGTFHEPPLNEAPHFAARLDGLLSQLPLERFMFAVEVRNPEFLQDGGGYLECLRNHRVAHCLSSWTRMPPLDEQMRVPGIFTAPHTAARLLLKPGRTYRQAVERFAPYERIQDPYPEGRNALRRLVEQHLPTGRSLYAFVNNRFEGNAIETINMVTPGLD